MRITPLLAAALFAAPAFAQDDEPAGGKLAGTLADKIAERIATELADEVADRVAERLADRIAVKLADRLGEDLADRLADRIAADLAGEPGGGTADVDEAEMERVEPTDPVLAEALDLLDGVEAEWVESGRGVLRGTWESDGETAGPQFIQILGAVASRLIEEDGDAGYAMHALAGRLAADYAAELEPSERATSGLGTVFYNQACALALDGETDEAVAALDRAFEFGFSDVNLLEEDSDLDSLRDLPGFRRRVKAWKRAAEKAAREEAREELAAGESFPLEFTFTDTDGEEHSLADYAGKAVIVDIWGTWCPPCRAEIPSFVKLQENYGDAGLQILGLNYEGDDDEAAMETIREYAADNGMNYPTGPGGEETREMVPDFRGFPTTIFVGRDGTVRLKAVGLHDYAFLEAVVKELLAEKAPARKPAEAKKNAGGKKNAAGKESADEAG